jgi:Ran GTPase-activating protein (RanGAP) involved in mRNA processing and transport
LGKDENLNVVKPDFITGGESLANLLRENKCTLQSLIVSWNMIRLTGAKDFCQSLSVNKTLTYLDISYNCLGSEAGCTLGRSLLSNKTLRDLRLACNNIDAVACFTICVGTRENESLRYLNLDGNPIGEQGGRTLMSLPMVI